MRFDLRKLSLRIVVFWSLLSAAGATGSRYAIEALMPAWKLAAEGLSTSYIPMLKQRSAKSGDEIIMTAFVTRAITLPDTVAVPRGTFVEVSIDALHTLVPVIILFTALAAWPVATWRRRALMLASGLAAALIVTALTTPPLLAGKFDLMLADYAARAGLKYEIPGVVYWMIFCESGGRWLLPLLAATLCIVVTAPRNRSISAHST